MVDKRFSITLLLLLFSFGVMELTKQYILYPFLLRIRLKILFGRSRRKVVLTEGVMGTSDFGSSLEDLLRRSESIVRIPKRGYKSPTL